jgi:hypothetical protein
MSWVYLEKMKVKVLKRNNMKNMVEISAEEKRKNKFDNEFINLKIVGRFEKSEVRHIIGQLDDIIHK